MSTRYSLPGLPDIVIREVGDLPSHLPGGEAAGVQAQAREDELLIVVPGVGKLLIRGGRSIDFVQEGGAEPGLLALLISGGARAAIIHQRGELPLHAASLVPPGGDGALAICGESGAGKSTLAAELSRRGWELLADDVTRVTWNGNHPLAWPSWDSIKLWGDSCERLGIDPSGLPQISAGIEKYRLKVDARDTPIRLDAVCELVTRTPPGLVECSGREKASMLFRHTYRPRYVAPLRRQGDHFRIINQMAGTCRLFELYGAKHASVRELADCLERLAHDRANRSDVPLS